MVIALIANRQYKIRCKNGMVWLEIKDARHPCVAMGAIKYGKKITFIAQGDAYYYPWIQLENVNQR